MSFLSEYQARFKAVLDREQERRSDAFLDAPLDISSVPIAPITLRHWALMDATRSPLLIATAFHDSRGIELLRKFLPEYPESIAHALWMFSWQYSDLVRSRPITPQPARSVAWHQDQFIRAVKAEWRTNDSIRAASDALIDHVQNAFADLPEQTVSSSTGLNPNPSVAAHTAAIVHGIAKNYHWPEEYIIRELPLVRLWQYLRLIDRGNDPEAPVCNPSDGEKGRIYFELNHRHDRQPHALVLIPANELILN